MTASHGPVLYTTAQRAEAAEWFVLIRDESPERDFLQDWLRWMDADEGNRVSVGMDAAYLVALARDKIGKST